MTPFVLFLIIPFCGTIAVFFHRLHLKEAIFCCSWEAGIEIFKDLYSSAFNERCPGTH
jgi:hypothetical protein